MIQRFRTHPLVEIFLVSLKLGLTSFGGPAAHLGYFHEEYVRKRKWLDEKKYADLVALCQFLPGPASSQVGMGIGFLRAGLFGGMISFLGFTLPSVIALMVFAHYLELADINTIGWLHGLKIVAVAVVLQAIVGMGRNLASGKVTSIIAVLSSAVVLLYPTSIAQISVIAASAVTGMLILNTNKSSAFYEEQLLVRNSTGIRSLILFLGILFFLPIVANTFSSLEISLFDRFYRSGALVFGGGHVVLPLLERELVPEGLISPERFIAGYSAAQAVPGPLFTFASYLGTEIAGWKGMLIATLAIFLPGFLLVLGVLPFWNRLRRYDSIQKALGGVNAAVVGILLAAFYNPIFISSVRTQADFAFASILFVLLSVWKLPPWLIVLIGALGGYILY